MFTYEDAKAYLEHAKKKGSILGLATMQALMQELGNPQNEIPTVHIAGTNGKGSVGAFLASICKEANLRVARYCTPAVFHPLECWQMDGAYIMEEAYAKAMEQVKLASERIGVDPTYFELETALAFVYFREMQPDVLLLEVGMGGALDATNVLEQPLATVFTKISRDHMQFLGEDVGTIAQEKAGIMKKDCFAFWGQQEPKVQEVLAKTCQRVGAKRGDVYTRCVEFISQDQEWLTFSYLDVEYRTRMKGLYQVENAALAIAVFDTIWPYLLFGREEEISAEDIPIMLVLDMEYACKKGIEKAFWPGRFECIGATPLCFIDGAHNEDAVRQLAITVENSFTNPRLHLIIGILADKEREKMLEYMLPFAQEVYTITPPNERGLDGRVLAQEIAQLHERVQFCETIEGALQQACSKSQVDGCPILAMGSLSYLGQLKEHYKQICESRIEDV